MGSAHPPPNWPCSIQLQSGSGQGHHCGRSTWCLPNGLPSVSPMQGWWWFVYTALVPPRWPRLHRILTRGSILFTRGWLAGSSPAMTVGRMSTGHALIRLDTCSLYQSGVGFDLGPDERIKLRRRHLHRLCAEFSQRILDGGLVQRLGGFSVQPVDYSARRCGRSEQPDPEHVIGIRIAGFERGRNVGEARAAFEARHRKPANLMALDQRYRRQQRREIEIDAIAENFPQRLRGALERNMHGRKARAQPKALRIEVGRRTDAARPIGDRAGLRLGGGDQFLDGLEARRRHHQYVGVLAQRNDGSEIPHRVVGQP